MDHHEDMESYLAVIQSHPECAFLWFLSDTPLTEKQQKLLLSCPNLMVSLPIDAPSTASMAKALRRQKTLFGMHKVYQDADAAAYLLSFDHLYSQMEQSVFFFLVADDSCSKKVSGLFPMLFNSTASPHTAILPDRSAGRLPQN